MFIAFQIFAILGIFVGALIFFYGIALFNSYVRSAKALLGDEEKREDDLCEKDEQNTEVADSSEVNSDDANFSDNISTDDFNTPENIEKRKRIFSPLPYFMAIEGVMLFVFNAVMFILKFYYPKIMEFYLLLPVNIVFVGLSIFLDAMVLSCKKDDKSQTNLENDIDKNE